MKVRGEPLSHRLHTYNTSLTDETKFGLWFHLSIIASMKKLLLLLTLSFFSIQGFAAGCPDGSEPVKSISADGTYFEYKCGILTSFRLSQETVPSISYIWFQKLSTENLPDIKKDKILIESMQKNPLDVIAHPGAQFTPGLPIEGSSPVVHKFQINKIISPTDVHIHMSGDNWFSTGLFASAGQKITIKVPKDLVNAGLKIQIGSHIWGDYIFNHMDMRRFPYITYQWNLDQSEVIVNSSFGGLIYIVDPVNQQINFPKTSSWSISGAYLAPRYIHGKTALNDWKNEIRKYPAPWAEIESDKVILTVPSHAIRDLDNPDDLMEFWARAIDAAADLASISRVREFPQRYVTDPNWQWGAHAGYPIMMAGPWYPYLVKHKEIGLNYWWGTFHELGHNHQMNDWMWDGWGEVSTNLWSVYILETIAGLERKYTWDGMTLFPGKRQKRINKFIDRGRSFAILQADPALALEHLLQLQEVFGWELFMALHQSYQDKPVHKNVSDNEKIQQFVIRTSQITKTNLINFYKEWGFPIERSTIDFLANFNYPSKDLAIAQKIAEAIKTSEKSKSVPQSEEYPTVSIEESYEDILLNSARIDAKQKISGFTFIQENYHKMVKKDGVLVKSAPETEITGWYQRLPEENDWHTGIIFFEKGQLKWKNEAGVEWNLQPDINNNKLITGEDNPYQTEYEPDFMLIKTSEKSKSVSQSEEYPTVDYNTNLLELCKRDVEGLWTNKIKEDSFLFVVASENGNCEYGRGNTKYNAFKDCTKNQEDNNIVGICELYAEGEEVVWDGHLKPENSNSSSSKKLPDNSKFSRNRYGFKCNSGFKREGNNMCTKDLAIAQKIAEAIKTSEKSKSVSQSEEYPTVSIEESYEDILLNSARIDAKQKISGFTFIQENYHKMVKKDGVLVKSAPETEITGWYQRLPEENDWHTGIIFFKKGQLKWKNEAGVEWNLQPDINNNKLITGEDNPYQTEYEPDFTLIKSSEKSKSTSKEVSTLETNESVDYVERLKQVKALLDSGIINQDDFEKMKQKIIDTMN